MTKIQPTRASLALRSQASGETFSLSGEVLVGREVECDIQLNSIQVSRYHAKLTVAANSLFVEDLQSSNGTFVNGRPVKQRTEIGLGDQIAFDDVVFRVTSLHSGSADTTVMASVDNGALPPSPGSCSDGTANAHNTAHKVHVQPDIEAQQKQKQHEPEALLKTQRRENTGEHNIHGMTLAHSNIGPSGPVAEGRRQQCRSAPPGQGSKIDTPASKSGFPYINVLIGVLVLLLIIAIIAI